MRKLFGWTFALSILALGAAVASAEDKLVPEEGAVEIMLLRQASVRDDLKLSHDEAQKIHNFTREQWEKAKEASKLPAAERDKKFAAMHDENHRFIDKTITKEQRKRLQEIELQVAGLMCLTRPEIAKKLKLTDEQMKRVHEMQKEGRQEMEDFIYTSKPEVRKEKLAELRKTSRDRMLELLTDEQEITWAQLQGKPFKGEFQFGTKEDTAVK